MEYYKDEELMVELELEHYELYEFGHLESIEAASDDDTNLIPPFTLFTVYVQLPGEPVDIDHFSSPERSFYKLERKFPFITNPYVTCFKAYYYLLLAGVWYMSFAFIIYVVVTNW